jgi:hypothetical protein
LFAAGGVEKIAGGCEKGEDDGYNHEEGCCSAGSAHS